MPVPNPGLCTRHRDRQARGRHRGFWVQELNPDSDAATSEGIFVFTSSVPTANVGDLVIVTGTPKEYRPSSAPNSLTLTELDNPGRTVTVESSGNPLPAPVDHRQRRASAAQHGH